MKGECFEVRGELSFLLCFHICYQAGGHNRHVNEPTASELIMLRPAVAGQERNRPGNVDSVVFTWVVIGRRQRAAYKATVTQTNPQRHINCVVDAGWLPLASQTWPAIGHTWLAPCARPVAVDPWTEVDNTFSTALRVSI